MQGLPRPRLRVDCTDPQHAKKFLKDWKKTKWQKNVSRFEKAHAGTIKDYEQPPIP